MSERFFSDAWYRVENLRVSLRSQVRVHRHRYRGIAWYVLEDLASGKSHRVSLAAYHLVGRMDGKATVDEIWQETARILGDDAPSQDDVIQLLGQLHGGDLLRSDGSPDTMELLERHKKQAGKLAKQNLMSPMSFRIPLWDPNAFLDRTIPFVRPLVGPLGLILWLALLIPAGMTALREWGPLTENFSDRVLSADNMLIMLLVYPAVKALHELGHGYVAKAYGAEVREMGVMFLVFFPVPYVDASGSNAFRSKWRRAGVAAAGIMVELAIASVAMFAWERLEPGFPRALAFNAMVISGFSTLMVNGNPLLKFDGYYVFADLIEMPNLAGRATRYWGHLMDRYAFGAHGMRDFAATRAERIMFLIYAPAAFVYRIFLSVTIALMVASKFFVVGVVLALWSLTLSLVKPAAKSLWHVISSPRLRRERGRAVGITFGFLGAALLGAGLIPAPLATNAQGVLWTPETAILRAGANGFVAQTLVAARTRVAAGDLIAVLEEPAFAAQLRALQARAAELRLKHAQERVADPVLAAITALELEDAEARLASALEKSAKRQVRAPVAGLFEPAAPEGDLLGRYLQEGEIIGHVLPARAATIRAVVSQWDIDLVRERLAGVRLILPGDVWTSYQSKVLREVPAGISTLPSPALALSAGGDTATDPRDPDGVTTLARVFQIEIAAPPEAALDGFGGRVLVKFEHRPEPIARIVYRRLRQLFLSRFDA